MTTSDHDRLPVSGNLLYPKMEQDVKEKLKTMRQKAKTCYDRGARALAKLDLGQEVRVAGQRNKSWQADTCVEKLSDLSYLVQVNRDTGRRNRKALRPKNDSGTATKKFMSPTVTIYGRHTTSS